MVVSIISIGNSKGLRIKKSILEQYNIQDQVELILEDGQIVIRPIEQPRQGWDKAFQQMAEAEDDKPLMEDVWEEEAFEAWN
ncbi:MAG: AbrB/MazE/SpoVT family DNA-binding domain-containing protein [Bacteroidota bacterium]